jgi:hypothetical protein
MNIFYLDRDPVIAAQMVCDKHVHQDDTGERTDALHCSSCP